jgi:hypothetical protein
MWSQDAFLGAWPVRAVCLKGPTPCRHLVSCAVLRGQYWKKHEIKKKKARKSPVLSSPRRRVLETSGWGPTLGAASSHQQGSLEPRVAPAPPPHQALSSKAEASQAVDLQPGFPSPVPPFGGAPDSLSVSFLPPLLLGSSSGLLLFPQAPHLSFPAPCLLAKACLILP